MSDYFLDPAAAAAFSAEKSAKSDLVRGTTLFLGLNCFEAGQSQAVHQHADSDKFYLVVSGRARMSVGGELREAGAGMVVWAPAGVPHGVAVAHERTVLLVGMAPPPSH